MLSRAISPGHPGLLVTSGRHRMLHGDEEIR
jgi:hypothetical protein